MPKDCALWCAGAVEDVMVYNIRTAIPLARGQAGRLFLSFSDGSQRIPVQKIIVDGYNVIHADAELKQLLGAGIDRARGELVDWLSDYVGMRDVRVTVVFDGRGGLMDSEAVVGGRLQLVYSARGQSADDVIVEMIESHPNPREFIVVTSDMADIGRKTRALGATLMSSRDFLARIDQPPAARNHRAEQSQGEVDVDYWLDQFGDSSREDE